MSQVSTGSCRSLESRAQAEDHAFDSICDGSRSVVAVAV